MGSWHAFISAATGALCEAARVVHDTPRGVLEGAVEVHLGQGRWGDQVEISAKVSLYCEAGMHVETLSARVKQMAGPWDQDAIAVITGSTLVTK